MSIEQKLYLFEFLVSKVNIQNIPIPQLQHISVRLRCGEFLDVTISSEEFSANTMDKAFKPASGEFVMELGKTFLFPSISSELITLIQENPLQIILQVSKQQVGTSLFTWRKEFADMIRIFDSIGVVKSVNYEGNFDMMDGSKKVGSMYLIIKMSCLGESVDTYLSLHGPDAIFMNPKTMTQLKCEMNQFLTNKIHPIAPIYDPALMENQLASAVKLSWTDIFGKGHEAEKKTKGGAGSDAVSVVSMAMKPDSGRVHEFLSMMTANVTTTEEETIVTVAIDKAKAGLATGKGYRDPDLYSVDEELTAERLNRKLCKNKDCEAVRKFCCYGIGPLKPTGMGVYYTIAEPHTSYGMSHLQVPLSRYGPEQFYRRPKDPYQEYLPCAHKYHGSHRIKARDLCYCTPFEKVDNMCCCCMNPKSNPKTNKRLRGGGKRGNVQDEKGMKLCKMCRHVAEKHPENFRNPLRIKGGGIIENNSDNRDLVVSEVLKKIVNLVSI